MQEKKYEFSYKVFDNIDELTEDQQKLLIKAIEVTGSAYAPYSRFKVGAVAMLANGELVCGSNQENASFPAGLCAERVLLSSISSQYPGIPIEMIAISYKSDHQASDHPVAPCGICRQSLHEMEKRLNHPIQLLLGGSTGKVLLIESIGQLLPLAFTSEELYF
jgi:cytidine deaminase